MIDLIDCRDLADPETVATPLTDLIIRRDLDDPGTATTSMIELIDCRDRDDPAAATTLKTGLIGRRDLDDPGIGTTSTAVVLIARQHPSVRETLVNSMRTRPIDQLYPGDPETVATAGMIERVDQPLHLRPLYQPDRHGRDDPDMDSLLSPTAPLEAE